MDLHAILNKAIEEIKEGSQESLEKNTDTLTENAVTEMVKGVATKLGVSMDDAYRIVKGKLSSAGDSLSGVYDAAKGKLSSAGDAVTGFKDDVFRYGDSIKHGIVVPDKDVSLAVRGLGQVVAHPTEAALAAGGLGVAGAGGAVANEMMKSPIDKFVDNVSDARDTVVDKYNDAVDYAKDKYNDAANWASENPELATALGVGIPGALLAGAGALALRRRQRNAK